MTKKNAVMPVKTTQKKVKFCGTQNYINAETGEMVPMHVTDIEERDFNFSKVWMRNFIATLELVGNKKTKLCFWLIDNLDKENKISLNYRQIAERTELSLDTVRVTMKVLQDVDFLRKLGTAYVVNPDIVFKGSRGARLSVLQDFHSAPQKEMSDSEKANAIRSSIAELQSQLAKIEKRINVVEAEMDDQFTFTPSGDIVQKVTTKQHKRKRS